MFVGLVRDITARKQQEQAHRGTREESTGPDGEEIAQVGGWEIDLITSELKWSEEAFRLVACRRIAGQRSKRALTNCSRPSPADDQRRHRESDRRAWRLRRGSAHGESQTAARSGLRVTASGGSARDGRPVRMVGAIQDREHPRCPSRPALKEANEQGPRSLQNIAALAFGAWISPRTSRHEFMDCTGTMACQSGKTDVALRDPDEPHSSRGQEIGSRVTGLRDCINGISRLT